MCSAPSSSPKRLRCNGRITNLYYNYIYDKYIYRLSINMDEQGINMGSYPPTKIPTNHCFHHPPLGRSEGS